jgi:coenzyme F420-reducing hydrogenase delta subunit
MEKLPRKLLKKAGKQIAAQQALQRAGLTIHTTVNNNYVLKHLLDALAVDGLVTLTVRHTDCDYPQSASLSSTRQRTMLKPTVTAAKALEIECHIDEGTTHIDWESPRPITYPITSGEQQ